MGDSDAEASAVATSSRPTVATLDRMQDELLPTVDGRGRQAEQDRVQVLEERTFDGMDERLETQFNDSRRRTLSPSRAALLQSTETGRIGGERRRDTVSPEALATVLKDVEGQLKEMEKEEERGELETTVAAVQTCEKTLNGLGSRPVTFGMLSCAMDGDRGNVSSWMDEHVSADGLTGELRVASSLLEQEGVVRRTTLDPTEAALVVAALQKEAASLSNGVLEVKAEVERDTPTFETDEMNLQTLAVSNTQVKRGTKVSNQVEENGESAAVSTESGIKSPPSLPHESACSKSLSPLIMVESEALPSLSKKTNATRVLVPAQSYSRRRTTVDPCDALVVLEDNAQLGQEDGRRQTIDEHGLLELSRAAGSPPAGKEDTAEQRKKLARKHDSDSIVCAGSRNNDFRHTNGEQSMEPMDIDSTLHTSAQDSSASTHQQRTGVSDLSSLAKSAPSHILESSMFSPPPGESRTRTPLKGILSARKMQRNTRDAVQTTPNKSVNFGPSQGAEFNYGSPSTSMTPMLAKDALRLFPLEPRVSSDEEPDDDAETSLNSSILDEADSLDEGELRKARTYQAASVKKSGFDLLQSRRNLSQKLTDKSRRRQSFRGYSPLDSHAEARRRRRQTINFTRRSSTSEPAVPTTFAATENPGADSSFSTRNQSFLSANDVTNTGRMPYVDSSASSDTGEDMEITGEYSFMLGRDVDVKEKQSTLAADQVLDEDTAKYSLGHLLAEASMYDLTKSVPEPDLPGSLSDLANEAGTSSQDGQAGGLLLSSGDQDTTLDPIQEKDEIVTSSRGQSMMSLDSDESDEEYAAKSQSLQVNLKAKFDRVSTDGGTNSHQPVPDEEISVHLITMKELFSSVALNEEDALVEMCDAFFGEEGASFNDQVSKNAELACAYDTCSEVVERHTRDVSSWSGAVAEELSSLLDIKAPAVFSPDILDDTGREAIQKLYATEVMVARTGWCQLQAQVEKQLTNGLAVSANALANDVKLLKDRVTSDALKRQDELSAIQEMIDREEQIALLLDAIEEQQGAHAEYVTAVSDLEKEYSSLSLEESVLQSRLKVLEGRAAELEPVTLAAASQLEEDVLATEEMLAIQESMCVWKIREATALHLLLSARYEDVLFDVEICVDVHVGSLSMAEASTSIKTHEFLKHKEQHTYLPYESDVVLVLQRLLLDPHYISRIADESDLGDRNYGYTLSKLQVLEHFINRSYRLLKELRELSTRFDMHYDEEGSTLWVDFLKFPSMASRVSTEGAKFSVGFSLLPVFPYTDYHTAVQVLHGQVSCDAVTKEIELVTRQEPKYFTRVCWRLHENFVR